MATQIYTVDENDWLLVSNGACLVELPTHCTKLLVTTVETGRPDINTRAYHRLSSTDARCFSYGGSHNVFIRSDKGATDAIVTGDNIL